MTAVVMFAIIQAISNGIGGVPVGEKNQSLESAFNDSVFSSSLTPTAITSSSSASSKSSFLQSPDYIIRLRHNNRTSLFYAYFHSVEEKEKGRNVDLIPLPMRREPGDEAPIPKQDYDDKGAMYFGIVIVLIYGISITLVIASTVRNSRTDDELKIFMRSFAGVKHAKRQEEKQRVHQLLQRHESHGPLSVLPEPRIDSTSIPLRHYKSPNQDFAELADATSRSGYDDNPSLKISGCISTQPSVETTSFYDSVPFIDE